MEKFSNAIKCRQCRYVLETPVLLPCSHSVCKKHENERKHVVCYECDTEYEVPSGGFADMKALSEIIDSKIYENLCEIDFGPAHKSAVKKCDQLKEIMEKIEELVKDPINYIYESISELKLRIDLAREELKLKIDEEAEVILRKLVEYESECKKSSASNENESKIKEIVSKLNKQTLDLDEWTSYLSNLKFDSEEFANIEDKCDESIGKLKDELNYFQESLLMDKCDETKRVVIGFEKIKISFDYKSPIEGKRYQTLNSNCNDESCVVVLKEGTLVFGHISGDITFWNAESQTIVRTLSGHNAYVYFLKELSDGSLASASKDNTIKIWNLQSGQLLRSLESHTDYVYVLEQLNDELLASGSNDGTIKIWNFITGELIETIEIGEGEKIYSLALFRNGNLACIVGKTKFIIIDSQTKKIVHTIENDSYNMLSLLSDGSLAIGQTDSDITIWNVDDWRLLRTLKGHKSSIRSLKSLSDGNLASGSCSGEVIIWNVLNGQILNIINVNNDNVAVFFIDQLIDGSLVTLSKNRACHFWK